MEKKENNKELQFKNVPFKIIECKEEKIDGVDYFRFKGYASTFGNADLGDDVCMKGCFTKSLLKRTPKLLWQHDSNMPLGMFPVMYEDDKGLYFEAIMPKSDTFVSGRVVPQMQIGSIDTMSIGYNTIEYEMIKNDAGTIYRALKELDLWESSLVTFAMNPEAQITDNVKQMIANFKNIGDVSKCLKKFFTKSQADDIIFSIKKLCSCNKGDFTPCNEDDMAKEFQKTLENLNSLNKEITL